MKVKKRRTSLAPLPFHGAWRLSQCLLILHYVSLAWSFSTRSAIIGGPQHSARRHYLPSSTWNNQQQCSKTRPAMEMVSPDQLLEEVLEELISETASLSVTPADEAAMLTDLAEVSSDIVILSSAPETIFLRLSTVIGKILELLSDYIPDHMIRSDELVFNLPIMVTSIFLLFRSAEPILKAQYVELDDMDLTAFELCFQPVGVTLLQFKSMKATGCFEWMEYEAGKVLIDENEYNISSLVAKEDDTTNTNAIYSNCNNSNVGNNKKENKNQSSLPADWKYLYWQYNGCIIRSFKGKVFSSIDRNAGMHIDYPGAQGLLGDTRFLYHLEEESRVKQKQQRRKGAVVGDAISDNYQLLHPIPTVIIGELGAKLLRIDSHKLFDLMDHDERLESSIRLLLLKSLKLKIGNLLFALQDDNAHGDDGRVGFAKKETPDSDITDAATDSLPVATVGNETMKPLL